MALVRCEQGHHYDPQKHSSCPFCGIPGLEVGSPDPTRPVQGGPRPAATPSGPREGKPPTPPKDRDREPKGNQQSSEDEGDDRTIRRDMGRTVVDPVVGWLVCTEGPERGRDFRIRSDKNFIGRSEEMHICLRLDKEINRVKHAVVSFNPRNSAFKLHPGEGTGLVYLNGEDLDVPTSLKPYDVIELGRTKLVFVPLCGEHFQWEEK